MLFARLVAPDTIDEIAVLNRGVRPPDKMLNNDTIFVYSDSQDDTFAEFLTQSEFDRDYRWIDPWPGRTNHAIRARDLPNDQISPIPSN